VPEAGEPAATLRLRRGGDCRVVDLSHGGALIEGPVRLEPGRQVEFRMAGRAREVSATALVVRAAVAQVMPDRVTYRAALKFDRLLDV
jgi:hypothetical protein